MSFPKKTVPILTGLCLFMFLSAFHGTAFAEGDVYDRIYLEESAEKTEVEPERPCPEESRNGRVTVIVDRFMSANPELEEYAAGKYAEYILEASDVFGVHPFLIAAIIVKESTVRYKARSRYAYGLMQINWGAHKKGLASAFSEISTLEDLIQPRNNILAGTYIFSCYLNSSDGDVSEALAMYLGRNGKKYIKWVMENFEVMVAEFEEKQEQRITILPGRALCLGAVA